MLASPKPPETRKSRIVTRWCARCPAPPTVGTGAPRAIEEPGRNRRFRSRANGREFKVRESNEGAAIRTGLAGKVPLAMAEGKAPQELVAAEPEKDRVMHEPFSWDRSQPHAVASEPRLRGVLTFAIRYSWYRRMHQKRSEAEVLDGAEAKHA